MSQPTARDTLPKVEPWVPPPLKVFAPLLSFHSLQSLSIYGLGLLAVAMGGCAGSAADATAAAGPDRARILVEVFDAASGDAADVAVIEGRGEPAAEAAGVDTPADALETPLRSYAARLLPAPATAAAR